MGPSARNSAETGSAQAVTLSFRPVFVFPTREDCFGLVLVEALAVGLPIVSSKYAAGAYDVIKEGINGIIVDPFVPSELARGIEKYLRNTEDMRVYSKDTIDAFRFSDVIQHFYKELNRTIH